MDRLDPPALVHAARAAAAPRPPAAIVAGLALMAGSFHSVCTFHPQAMEGTVEVTAASGSENP